MKIAVIPARGGSKRIQRKNIRNFCGKPIIAYTIEALQESGVVDKIWVSTDDEEIAEVAKSFGAEIPFWRPLDLSNDTAGTLPVMVHAVKEMIKKSLDPNCICCAYATAPLMKPSSIVKALEKMKNHQGYAFPATRYNYPIWRSFKVDEDECVDLLYPEKIKKRSQDLPSVWHDAGQFYWGTLKAWLEELAMIDKYSKIIELPSWQVIDIDNEEDWIQAELYYQLQKQNKKCISA